MSSANEKCYHPQVLAYLEAQKPVKLTQVVYDY